MIIGIKEKKTETTMVYWGSIGIMEDGNYHLGFRL